MTDSTSIMPSLAELTDRIARSQGLRVLARETRAAARNLRHTAVLRRALYKLMHSGDPRQWTRIWTDGRVTPSSRTTDASASHEALRLSTPLRLAYPPSIQRAAGERS